MKYLTDDVRITGMEEVIAPEDLLAELPINDDASELIFSNRKQIGEILRGDDPRLLVVIGPCSIHDPGAALEYADRLAEVGGFATSACRGTQLPDIDTHVIEQALFFQTVHCVALYTYRFIRRFVPAIAAMVTSESLVRETL